jgi:uncharacterized protein (TIGR00369 family)
MKDQDFKTGLSRRMGGPIAHDEELGIAYEQAGAGSVSARLMAHPHICGHGDIVSLGALATVLDTACGVAAMASQDFNATFSTMNLRIDFIRPAQAGQMLITTADPVSNPDNEDPRSVVVRGCVQSADGNAPYALAIGQFIRLDVPNLPQSDSGAPPPDRSDAPSYASLMGMQDTSADTLCLPYRKGLLGNGLMPALHGGVIAALMQECALRYVNRASKRPMDLTSIDVSFLTFGRPQDLLATASPVHLGRTTATVDVVAHQSGITGRRTATARATFI